MNRKKAQFKPWMAALMVAFGLQQPNATAQDAESPWSGLASLEGDYQVQPVTDYNQQFTLGYNAYFNGMKVGELIIEFRVSADRYYIELKTRSTGFYDTIIGWRSLTFAQGRVESDGLAPDLYIARSSGNFVGQRFTRVSFSDNQVDTWETTYNDLAGERNEENQALLSESIDPLTALLLIFMRSSESVDCDRLGAKIFDSRVSAVFHFETIDSQAPEFVENAVYILASAERCQMRLDSVERVNKEDTGDEDRGSSDEKPRDPILFFQEIGSKYPILPVVVQFPIPYGEVNSYLVQVQSSSGGT